MSLGRIPVRQETLLTGRGGRLKGRLWIGEEDPLGVLLVIHGLGDHSGRYEALARHLVGQRWSVCAFDLPGHGLSPGDRGRVDSFDGLLGDIAFARASVRERFADLPQVVFGNSMGGNLAINYALRRGDIEPRVDGLAGLLLCADAVATASTPASLHFCRMVDGLLVALGAHQPPARCEPVDE